MLQGSLPHWLTTLAVSRVPRLCVTAMLLGIRGLTLPPPPPAGSMTEAESMESVSSGASGLLAQLHQHQQRSGSLTQNRLINYGGGQWDAAQGGQSPRLSRSNSIRSVLLGEWGVDRVE